MHSNRWFADRNTPEDEDDYHPGYEWQPFLQCDGYVARIAAWFQTEAACVEFIKAEVIGAPFKP